MECSIYKGKRNPDHYIFLPADTSINDIPENIQQMMGELTLVMNLDITTDTVLAQSDPVNVLSMIDEKGFFIQIPPKTEINIDTEEY